MIMKPLIHSIKKPTPPLSQSGISLIELMIGVTIGLIVTLAVTSTVSIMNIQRRTTVSGNDATESARYALTLLERSARLGGAGLFYNGQLLCTSAVLKGGGAAVAIAPAKIVDGGTTGSDTISFTYGSAVGGNTTAILVDNMADKDSNFTVNNSSNLANNDEGLVGVPGSTVACTHFQVSAAPVAATNCNSVTTACSSVAKTSGSNLYYGYQNSAAAPFGPAVISRLGTLTRESYQVLCNSLVLHDSGAAPTCTASPLSFTSATPLVDDVVMIQAQYGITDTPASDIVTSWVDATGGWETPSATDLPRIKAIRIAVVARSKEPATTTVTSSCTNAGGVANTGPCSFEDASAPVINLSATSVPSGRTWQNYRYRVYQSVIPLRNVSWNY